MPVPSQRLLTACGVLVLLAGAAGVGVWISQLQPDSTQTGGSTLAMVTPGKTGLPAALAQLEAQEQSLDQTVWAKERLAERAGGVIDDLWDTLNASSNRWGVLAAVSADNWLLPEWPTIAQLPNGVTLRRPADAGRPATRQQWAQVIQTQRINGWMLMQMEFRHVEFETDASGRESRSRYWMTAHLTNSVTGKKAALEGNLRIDWSPAHSPSEKPGIKAVNASHLTLALRDGEPGYQLTLDVPLTPLPGSRSIDPLLVSDLDGDGTSEIVLAGNNLVARRQPDGRFEVQQLCAYFPGRVDAACIADFTNDAHPDFLCANSDGLILFQGSADGRFDFPGQRVWTAGLPLLAPQVLTCGDIDGDGDLDVWLGQYKVPYQHGQMPTPYYDANDGAPSFLLVNNGHGQFADQTTQAGLGAKRWRRTYSASLAHLEGQAELSLIVVSDFSGLDVYGNDGRGRFSELTGQRFQARQGFGMAHALADFDRDGRLDLLMIGMNSPTAGRLEHLGLERPGAADRPMRRALTYGNRLYLAQSDGTYRQTALNEALAQTGWSWGCAALDFDNDGFVDAFIANGHDSRKSVRDYEPEFWLHDIYVANSKEAPLARAYFDTKFARLQRQGWSYGGYEKNRLFWNQHARTFYEVGHLMGVALETSCRNVVAEDLDADGRMDLLVTTFETWPEPKQTLKFYRNTLSAGNWIGFKLREQGGGVSPVGARVTIWTSDQVSVREVVTGDSYRSQHANTVHFGLGQRTDVEKAEVRWTNGRSLVLTMPEINQYHSIWLPPEPLN